MIHIGIKLSLLLVTIFSFVGASAQVESDVCTPKGNTVIAYITPENTNYWRNYFDTYYANAYPNAIQIETYDGFSSTRRFNCHGYAWHVVDGGSARWIGIGGDNDPEYTYWQDGSYIEVAQSVYPGKVNWSSGDHSAITTENPGVLISKWNEYPLMKHAWDDSPYGTSNLKYYKLNFSITGSGLVCNSDTTFILSPTPGGSVNWTKSSNLSFVGGSSGTSVTVKTVSSSTSGNGELHANFTSGCGTSFVVDKPVWAGPPIVDYIKDQYDNQIGVMFCPDVNYGFWPENDILCEPSSYYWSITPTSGIGYGFCSTCQNNWITFTETGVHYLSVTESNTCGTGNTFTSYIVVAPCGYYSYSVSPNPASTEVTLTKTFVQDTTATNKTPLSVSNIETNPESNVSTVKIYNNLGTLFYSTRKTGDEFTIPVNNLKEGSYIVEVNDGKQSYSEPLIIKH